MISNFKFVFATLIITFVLPVLPANASDLLFTNEACHPRITQHCALYPYTYNQHKGRAPYVAVVKYFNQMSNGLIRENPEFVTLKDHEYHYLENQDRNDLFFKFDTRSMTFTPDQDLSSETVDRLFTFDTAMFLRKMGVSDFISGKMKYYEMAEWNRAKYNFERQIMLPTDWRSLIHPPVFKLEEIAQKSSSEGNRSPASQSPFWEKDYHLVLDADTRTELTQGNELRLMVNNVSYSEKIKLVQEAKKYIFVAVMSFAYTPEGKRLIDLLIQRAQEGLDVRVIMEKVWGKVAFNKTIKALRAGGVKVALSNDLLRASGRNQGLFHSKYFVIDGERGVVGGQNLVDRSHKATGYNHFNKDTDVRVEGPIVTDMLENYVRLWERFTKSVFPAEYRREVLVKKEDQRKAGVRGTENYDGWLAEKAPGLCRFVSQGPNEDKFKISKAYYETFGRAQHDILMTTQIVNFQKAPLFKQKWSTVLYRELMDKARSGIPVNLITNGIDGGFLKSDENEGGKVKRFFSRLGNKVTGYLNTALRRGKLKIIDRVPNFEVWQHFQYIHSKVAIVDQTVSAIGSYNFETYSAEHSYETAVFCQDQKLTENLQDDLIMTIANSVPVTE